MPPEDDRRLAEGDVKKKLKSILVLPEGGHLDSLLLAGHIFNLPTTLSLGNFSRRRVRCFKILKYQINLEKKHGTSCVKQHVKHELNVK